MKQIFLFVMLLLCLQPIFACDICGNSSGNYFIGPFPQFHKHFFGSRYSFRRFHSHVKNDATQFSKDFYQTIEFWGGVNMGRKWQLMAFVPYNFNWQHSDDGIKKQSGPGDVSILSNYKLIDYRNVDHHGNLISQQLMIGGGFKLPTGKFDAEPAEVIPGANNQPGTGSIDFLLNAMYTFHINEWGFHSNINYKINTGASHFKFGNRLGYNAFVFHSLSAGSITFNPNVGVLYEQLNSNEIRHQKINDTGGNALLAAGGTEVNFSKIAIGFNVQLPLRENLSNGQTHTNVKGMLHLTFIL